LGGKNGSEKSVIYNSVAGESQKNMIAILGKKVSGRLVGEVQREESTKKSKGEKEKRSNREKREKGKKGVSV